MSEKLKIKKIEECEKENLEIQGQSGGCWHDCKTWYGNTTIPKCEYIVAQLSRQKSEIFIMN